MANTKYNIGQKLFVERRGECESIEILDICYVLDGRINNKKYITEWELEEAIKNNDVQLTPEIYRKKKIAEKRNQLKKLQDELDSLEKGIDKYWFPSLEKGNDVD